MRIVGLMSGTSADGIDAALCEITGAPPDIHAEIVKAITVPYPDGFQKFVQRASGLEASNVATMCQLNFTLGELFAQAALQVISAAGLAVEDVDLIGSHGQTVWHNVDNHGTVTATLQLADGTVIAERTGITTISNFRQRDVAAGGQGAPLTAYVDWLLLRHPDHWRAIQNIGGISNVTFLPPLSDTESRPLAFDTGPGNSLMDAAMHIITDGRRAYDINGTLARLGTVDEQWLRGRLMHPYFNRRPPKTTGREMFGSDMAASLVRMCEKREMSRQDIMANMTAFTARSIAAAYKRFAPAEIKEVVLSGGGAKNSALVNMLREQLDPIPVIMHKMLGITGDDKEALAFALLAHETWHNRPGVMPELTGAKHATVLGHIAPGDNYADLIRRTWTP